MSKPAAISMKQAMKAHERMRLRWEEDVPVCMNEAFHDPEVTEVMIENTKIMTDRHQLGIQPVGSLSEFEAEALANVIASLMGKTLTQESPTLEGELPFNSYRVAIAIPPVTTATTITIRKHNSQIFSLEDYEAAGSLTPPQKTLIEQWILARKNILVVGGTASGKTTFINSLIDKITVLTPDHRLIILEDTVELQCSAYSYIQMRSTETVTLQDLVKTTLRHRPDRIIVGEVRGKEAFDLLTAWSTGHPGGIASLHANSALGAFSRLEQLNQIAVQTPLKALITEAIDAIIYLEKTPEGRKVKELLEVRGLTETGQYDTQSGF